MKRSPFQTTEFVERRTRRQAWWMHKLQEETYKFDFGSHGNKLQEASPSISALTFGIFVLRAGEEEDQLECGGTLARQQMFLENLSED